VIALVGYPTHAMTSRLHRALARRGHACELIHPDELVTVLDGGDVVVAPLAARGPGARWPDVVVLTVSTDHVAALLSAGQLERRGIPVLNRPAAVLLAADKAEASLALHRAGVPVPRMAVVASEEAALRQAERLGYPLVLKAADGAEGDQVRRAHGETELSAAFRELRSSMGHPPGSRVPLVLQELLQPGLGRDRRLFLVGGAVQAAMDREARPGEWRSNLSQGAEPSAAEPSEEEVAIAERAAAVLGLQVTTIDLMAGANGPVVVEANPHGDVLDVAMTSGLDLIGAMADLVEMRAGLRPLDRVVARPLGAAALATLTAFCRRRLEERRRVLSGRS
jgi:RimK family alpha-L-glutamate ligase